MPDGREMRLQGVRDRANRLIPTDVRSAKKEPNRTGQPAWSLGVACCVLIFAASNEVEKIIMHPVRREVSFQRPWVGFRYAVYCYAIQEIFKIKLSKRHSES